MARDLVIVRSSGGRPLRRVALSTARGLVYISSERALAAVEAGAMPSLGFPRDSVFLFDEASFDALEREWQERGAVDQAAWAALKRFEPLPASRG